PGPLKMANQSYQSLIKCRISPKAVVNPISFLRKFWKFLIELIDGERCISTIVSKGTLRSRSPSCPYFSLAILWLNKKREFVFGMVGREYGNRVWFFEAGEIVEIGILAVRVFDIRISDRSGRGRKDGNATAYAIHELLTSLFCVLRWN